MESLNKDGQATVLKTSTKDNVKKEAVVCTKDIQVSSNTSSSCPNVDSREEEKNEVIASNTEADIGNTSGTSDEIDNKENVARESSRKNKKNVSRATDPGTSHQARSRVRQQQNADNRRGCGTRQRGGPIHYPRYLMDMILALSIAREEFFREQNFQVKITHDILEYAVSLEVAERQNNIEWLGPEDEEVSYRLKDYIAQLVGESARSRILFFLNGGHSYANRYVGIKSAASRILYAIELSINDYHAHVSSDSSTGSSYSSEDDSSSSDC